MRTRLRLDARPRLIRVSHSLLSHPAGADPFRPRPDRSEASRPARARTARRCIQIDNDSVSSCIGLVEIEKPSLLPEVVFEIGARLEGGEELSHGIGHQIG